MSALDDIRAERLRQISEEGCSVEHDDEHDGGEMAAAAACYARGSISVSTRIGDAGVTSIEFSVLWPWDKNWWKPSTPRRNLVKAGALIIAEIERLDRAAIRTKAESP